MEEQEYPEKEIRLQESKQKDKQMINLETNSKKKSKSRWKDDAKLIFQILLHYLDFITDIILLIEYYFYMNSLENTEDKINLQIILLFMVYLLLYERYQLYTLCLQIQYYLKNKQKQNKITGNKQKQQQQQQQQQQQLNDQQEILPPQLKRKILCQVITFIEQINFFALRNLENVKSNDKIQKYINEKKVSDLVTENYFFYKMGLIFLLDETVHGNIPSIAAIFSPVFSYISIITVHVNLYFLRYENSYKYKELNYQEFQTFPIDLQLYLADPSHMHLLKFHINVKGKKYKQYLKKDKNEIKDTIKPKLNKKQKIYIFLYVLIYTLSFGYILVLQVISKYYFNTLNGLILGYIYFIPLQIQYYKIWKKKKTNKISFKLVIKEVFRQLVVMVIGGFTFSLTVMVQEIPFLRHIKCTWRYNYIRPWIFVLYFQILQTYMLYITMDSHYQQHNYSDSIVISQEDFDFVSDQDGLFSYLILVAQILYVLNFLLTVLYFVDKACQKIYPKKEQQPVQQRSMEKKKEKSIDFNDCQVKSVNIDDISDLYENYYCDTPKYNQNKKFSSQLKDKTDEVQITRNVNLFKTQYQFYHQIKENSFQSQKNSKNYEFDISRNISLIDKQYKFPVKNTSFNKFKPEEAKNALKATHPQANSNKSINKFNN